VRAGLHFAAALFVAAVAFWAYKVNYAAQDALDRVAALRAEIARERDAIRVLEAEWAWLNAPDRLHRLLAQHGERLALEPMDGARYAGLDELPLRAPAPDPEPALAPPGEALR
jgi:hypothetical protein